MEKELSFFFGGGRSQTKIGENELILTHIVSDDYILYILSKSFFSHPHWYGCNGMYTVD